MKTAARRYLKKSKPNRDVAPGLGVCHQRIRSKQMTTMGEAPQERGWRFTERVAAWWLLWGRACLPQNSSSPPVFQTLMFPPHNECSCPTKGLGQGGAERRKNSNIFIKHFPIIIFLSLYRNTRQMLLLHFTGVKTEVLRGKGTCLSTCHD